MRLSDLPASDMAADWIMLAERMRAEVEELMEANMLLVEEKEQAQRELQGWVLNNAPQRQFTKCSLAVGV